ncbi:DMT family transporter [Bradyrhizobium genosp. L]|uniref:DMT family transporter n=1 Tax=Bradyrhizobium genosp. L TaxID=83637 RepID=UPI0018A26996|nr:DMT family transporter [Bradyrhizobium genosp. L]QPF86502.1 DMT family transporter [Bradyrhizobium genosp. L]
MTDAVAQHRKGIAVIVAAAVAWSTAPFFTRLLHFDSWTILFWRGLFGGGAIALFLVAAQGARGVRDLIAMPLSGWLVAGLSTFGMVTFIPALQLTSVANVAVIIAMQPFAAAAIAWIWLREQARLGTLLASLIALAGITITVSGAGGITDYRGIGLACLMALAIALMTVVIRRHRGTPMIAAAALSNFLGSVVSLPFAHGIGAVTAADLGVLAAFGVCQVGLGLTLFTVGSRYLPSGQASLIATLETPLMPFWVWLAFAEVPSVRALIGGALVIGAVVADIVAGRRVQPAQPTER